MDNNKRVTETDHHRFTPKETKSVSDSYVQNDFSSLKNTHLLYMRVVLPEEVKKSLRNLLVFVVLSMAVAWLELPEWNFKSDMFSHRHSVLCMKVFET